MSINYDDFCWGPISTEDKSIIAEEIFTNNVYEKFNAVQEGNVVVDIGANVGAFTRSILHKNPSVVYCIEPAQKLIDILKYNTRGGNVVYVPKAILNFTGSKAKDETNNIFCTEFNERFDSITFNDFVLENKIERIDFLKCDCESGEYDIFTPQNFSFIRHNVRWISGEWHVWGFPDVVNRFAAFRDLYLKNQRFCVHDRYGCNITDKIFDNDFIVKYGAELTYGAQIIIYIDYRE